MSENAESKDKSITFEQTVTPSDDSLLSIFHTALEGGINYWSTCAKYRWESLPPSEAFAVIHEDENEGREHRITIDTIREGLRNIVTNQVKYNGGEGEYMARLAIGILVEEDYDYDAGDADNIVQAGLFKEIVYG